NIGKTGERAFMSSREFAGKIEKCGAARRQLHMPGCALDQPAIEALFEAFQLQAHSGLGGPHRLGRTRETSKLGDADESFNGIEIERAHYHFICLLQILRFISFQNNTIRAIVKRRAKPKGNQPCRLPISPFARASPQSITRRSSMAYTGRCAKHSMCRR